MSSAILAAILVAILALRVIYKFENDFYDFTWLILVENLHTDTTTETLF